MHSKILRISRLEWSFSIPDLEHRVTSCGVMTLECFRIFWMILENHHIHSQTNKNGRGGKCNIQGINRPEKFYPIPKNLKRGGDIDHLILKDKFEKCWIKKYI